MKHERRYPPTWSEWL